MLEASEDVVVILKCIDNNGVQLAEIEARRDELLRHSSYFQALFSGSFSESNLHTVEVQWDHAAFVTVVRSIYDIETDVNFENWRTFLEAALYFGVEKLLSRLEGWILKALSCDFSQRPKLDLDNLIEIWNFGVMRANDSVSNQCTQFLARNFEWATSCKSFGCIPHDLLLYSLRHPKLTVDSEVHLSEALLSWVTLNKQILVGSKSHGDIGTEILKQIQIGVLPLWFFSGKKNLPCFRDHCNESIRNILRMSKKLVFDVIHLDPIKLRVTEYSTKIDVSGCPQMTIGLLDHSLHSSSSSTFDAVKEIDISKCPNINIEIFFKCYITCFPSLRIVKAAYLSPSKTSSLYSLVKKCSMLCEVDLTVDRSSSNLTQELNSSIIYAPRNFLIENAACGLTKLTLEGRTDVTDHFLQSLSETCKSLCFLDVKGCTSFTDDGIAHLIGESKRLHSILACDTSFGMNSVLALMFRDIGLSSFKYNSLSSALKTLHIGGCQGIEEHYLKSLLSDAPNIESLCLRGAKLSDDALNSFCGSSLLFLDLSQTMISRYALTCVVRRNLGLKSLNVRDCRNISSLQSQPIKGEKCVLNEIVIGWGFSFDSLCDLTSSTKSLTQLTVCLGSSMDEESLKKLPESCPLLQSLSLSFQSIPNNFMTNMVTSFRHLQSLSLCYCFDEVSISGLQTPMPCLKKLKLQRAAPAMNNQHLTALTQYCRNIVELSLLGCRLLDPESLNIIAQGWPGLMTISLEECGEATGNGVFCLLNCIALEDMTLRHNGCGIPKSLIVDAASKFPMLRKMSLDCCDSIDGHFLLPHYSRRCSLSSVKVARCETQKVLMLTLPLHKETTLLAWSDPDHFRTVVPHRF